MLRYNHQTWWAVKLFFCNISNFVVVVLNLFFTNWYLGDQFMAYGPTSLDYINLPPAERSEDPFNLVFPKMTKCFMETYGPSGTIQVWPLSYFFVYFHNELVPWDQRTKL